MKIFNCSGNPERKSLVNKFLPLPRRICYSSYCPFLLLSPSSQCERKSRETLGFLTRRSLANPIGLEFWRLQLLLLPLSVLLYCTVRTTLWQGGLPSWSLKVCAPESDHYQGSSSQGGELLDQTKHGWASQFRVYTRTPKSLCLWLICWVWLNVNVLLGNPLNIFVVINHLK